MNEKKGILTESAPAALFFIFSHSNKEDKDEFESSFESSLKEGGGRGENCHQLKKHCCDSLFLYIFCV